MRSLRTRLSASTVAAVAALASLVVMAPARAAVGPWVVQPTPSPSATANILNAVAAVGGTAWAVGVTQVGSSQVDHTLILENAGSGWVRSSSPDDKHAGDTLTGIAAISPRNAWAVGDHQHVAVMLLHYDGNAWTRQKAPHRRYNGHDAWQGSAITATSATNAWLVGNHSCLTLSCAGYNYPFVEHWDGTAWKMQKSPLILSYVNAVDAVDRSHAWAVGSVHSGTFGLRWNGHKWVRMTLPTPNKSAALTGVAAVSRTNVWAVGSYRRSGHERTLVLHYNGKHWRIISSPNKSGRDTELNAVTALSRRSIWAAGQFQGRDGRRHTLLEHYDGAGWSTVPSPDGGTFNDVLVGVAGSSTAGLFAVGVTDTDSNHHSGSLALHCC